MHDFDFRNRRAQRRRRLGGWAAATFSLLIFIGVGIYSVRAGIVGVSHGKGNTPLINLPGFTQSTPVPPPCSTPSHPLGDSTLSITSGGMRRTFIVHLPPSYSNNQTLPIVFNYHGYARTAADMATYTNMGALADKENFIVVFPQGEDNPPSWNAGIGAFGPTGSADDVQFTRDMLGFLEKNYCVDTHRVYATGYSIGGSMAYRVACALSQQIAGLATVEGAFYHAPGGCQPSRPIPVLEIHGQADTLAPYDGDPGRLLAAVSVFLNVWFTLDKCNSNVSKTVFQQGDVTGIEWPNCADGTVVEHYRISDGGHVWPGAAPRPSLGFTTHTIDANVVVWNFFKQFHT